MKRNIAIVTLVMVVLSLLVLGSIGNVAGAKATAWEKDIAKDKYVHGLTVEIEGEEYWFKGPGSISGEVDVPGHTWKQKGDWKVSGYHYNVGPTMAPAGAQWWASGEDWGAKLYKVYGIIEVPPEDLTMKQENKLKAKGYVHVHEFVDENGDELEDYVVYLKHKAVRDFYFDGGPGTPMTDHMVDKGTDYNFAPNW